VYGGTSSISETGETWTLSLTDTPVWTSLFPYPPGRYNATSIYDPARGRMIMFGGAGNYPVYFNDVWELALGAAPEWNEISPAGTLPLAQYEFSAIYDSARDRMVVFGGHTAANRVWALSLAGTPAWTELATTGGPPIGRTGNTTIYDPARDRLVIFGGSGAITALNDIWVLPLSTLQWQQLSPIGTLPSARQGHTAIYDPVRDRMLVYGGNTEDYGVSNETWELTFSGTPAWNLLVPAGPSPRSASTHSAVYDSKRDRMVIFGGFESFEPTEIWALSLEGAGEWTLLDPTGDGPVERLYPSAIYDSLGDRLVAFGGMPSLMNDLWSLSWGTPPRGWPVLVSPPHGGNVSESVDLVWYGLEDALGYQVILAVDATLQSPIWTVSTATATSATYAAGPEFPVGATRYWSVRALFPEGWGPYAPARSITRIDPGDPLATPVLLAPVTGAEVALPEEFSWSEVADAAEYEVQFSNGSEFATVRWSTRTVANFVTVADAVGPTAGQTYYWRVRALGPGRESPWTPVGSFMRVTSVDPPGSVTLLSPMQGGSEPGPGVAFAWGLADRATSYDLWISTESTFPDGAGRTVVVEKVHETLRIVTLGATVGTIYWKVLARNSGGAGPSSEIWSFQYNRERMDLASCVIVTPPDGAYVAKDRVLLSSAVVAGAYNGMVTVEWYSDDVMFEQSQYTMPGMGFETDAIVVPTTVVGPHTLHARVTGPATVFSQDVDFTVTDRTYGEADHLALAAEKSTLAPGEATPVYCRILDANDRLVESVTGWYVDLSAAGGGSFNPNPAIATNGTATTTYTAPGVAGDVMLVASAPGLDGDEIVVQVRSLELERLQAEAHAYLDRLEDLRWDCYAFEIPLIKSIDVTAARAFVSGAVPGDEQRLRRLNMFLRVLDRGYYHDASKHGYGPAEDHAVIPGAQVLFDDAVLSLGHMSLALMSTMRFVEKQRLDEGKWPITRVFDRFFKNFGMWALDQIIARIVSKLPDEGTQILVREWWASLKTYNSATLAGYPGVGIAALVANTAIRAGIGNLFMTRGFIDPAQTRLDAVVSTLSNPSWTGGTDDTQPNAIVEAGLEDIYQRTTYQHEKLSATIDAFGKAGWVTALEEALGHWGGVLSLFRVGAVLNKAIEALVVWAAGVDCQTIAIRITGPNMLGYVANAVTAEYPGLASDVETATLRAPSLDVTFVAVPLHDLAPLSANRVVEPLLVASADRLNAFESVMREIEIGLADADSAAVAAAVDSLPSAMVVLTEGWGQLIGVVLSTSAAARGLYPDFPLVIDSLGVDETGAGSACMNSAALSIDWLMDTAAEDVRLLALANVRDAIERSTAYQNRLVATIADLLAMPSQAYLHASIPLAPDSLVTGAVGNVRSVITNLGAGTARGVSVEIVCDSTQLDVLSSLVIVVDSLTSGQSIECSWTVVMLERRFEGDSLLVVTGSVLPGASGAMAGGSSFAIAVGQHTGTGVSGGDRVPSATAIGRIYPNPASGNQTFEIAIAPGQPVSALRIYDVAGRLVATTDLRGLSAGVHWIEWDGTGRNGKSLPSGMYFATIRTDAGLVTQKFVRVR